MFHFVGDVEPIRSRTQEIPHYMRDPHYTDERFTRSSNGRTIYLAPGLVMVEHYGTETVEGAHYNYSDRISQWYGHDKVQRAWHEARERVGNTVTAKLYETWLQHVYEDPTTSLQHIIAGVNVSNGYSYRVFGTVSEAGPQAS